MNSGVLALVEHDLHVASLRHGPYLMLSNRWSVSLSGGRGCGYCDGLKWDNVVIADYTEHTDAIHLGVKCCEVGFDGVMASITAYFLAYAFALHQHGTYRHWIHAPDTSSSSWGG